MWQTTTITLFYRFHTAYLVEAVEDTCHAKPAYSTASSSGNKHRKKTAAKRSVNTDSTKQTWRVLGKAGADLVEAVAQRVDHLGDPLAPPLERPQVGDGSQAQGAALVLLEGLLGATPAQGVVAWQHHRITENAAGQEGGRREMARGRNMVVRCCLLLDKPGTTRR